jgi:hypothetical protein
MYFYKHILILDLSMDVEIAKKEVIAFLDKAPSLRHAKLYNNEPLITQFITLPFGWLFMYNGRLAVQYHDIDAAYVGAAPVLFDKYDGEIRFIRSIDLEEQLDNYTREKGYLPLAGGLPTPSK